jgi:hypothetical protein
MQSELINHVNSNLKIAKEEVEFDVSIEMDKLFIKKDEHSHLILNIDCLMLFDDEKELGHISELEYYPKFLEFNQCQDCFGEGFIEVGPMCSKPASMCCGGCYTKIECECDDKLFNY